MKVHQPCSYERMIGRYVMPSYLDEHCIHYPEHSMGCHYKKKKFHHRNHTRISLLTKVTKLQSLTELNFPLDTSLTRLPLSDICIEFHWKLTAHDAFFLFSTHKRKCNSQLQSYNQGIDGSVVPIFIHMDKILRCQEMNSLRLCSKNHRTMHSHIDKYEHIYHVQEKNINFYLLLSMRMNVSRIKYIRVDVSIPRMYQY